MKLVIYRKAEDFHSDFNKGEFPDVDWESVVCIHLRDEANFVDPEPMYDVCITSNPDIAHEYKEAGKEVHKVKGVVTGLMETVTGKKKKKKEK
jgi:hypothetical protein